MDMAADASPSFEFQRLDEDREEEQRIKGGTATALTQQTPSSEPDRRVLNICVAVAISILPVLLAGAVRRFQPGAVADAMSKASVASAAMMMCSFVGYGVSVPIRLLAAFQHLAAGLLVSSVAVELVPPIMEAPNSLRYNIAIIGGFVGGTAAFFALGAYCGEPEEEDEDEASASKEGAEAAAAVGSNGGTPRGTPRTPRGLTKLAHVQRAAELPAPPYPGALVAAVVVDSSVDGLLIGLASASAVEVANAGVVLAIALAIEMGFTGLAYASTLRKQPPIRGMLSIAAPPFVLLGASVVGAGAATVLLGYPSVHVAVVSFGATALLYLVVVELLREAHAGMGDDATMAIEAMFFVGFFMALLLERAMQSGAR